MQTLPLSVLDEESDGANVAHDEALTRLCKEIWARGRALCFAREALGAVHKRELHTLHDAVLTRMCSFARCGVLSAFSVGREQRPALRH